VLPLSEGKRPRPLVLDGSSLTISSLVEVARELRPVEIAEEALRRVEASRAVLEEVVSGRVRCYGITTGLGELSKVLVSPEEALKLQENIVLSHACAVGEPLPTEAVRAIMLLRANTLARGRSGVRRELVEKLIELLNKGVHPIIPSRGSVGASGDLAPLAHLALVITGRPEGRAEYGGRVMKADEALREAGIEPLKLDHKEGLALINGTSATTALLALSIHDAEVLVKTADVCLAMTLEAVGGFLEAFDKRYLSERPSFPLSNGHLACAGNVARLTRGSRLLRADGLKRPHDPYSVRCAPQVHGAVREGLEFAKRITEAELNSTDDNPLFFEEEPYCVSGGNFHGQPLALAADVLALSMTTLGNASERRTALLTTRSLNELLPSFLVHPRARAGLNSGFMIVQYVAASLASENKALSHPASVDSIPTSGNFEDLVSMSMTAALKAREVVDNVAYILAVEFVCACQALAIRGPGEAGEGTRAAYELALGAGIEPVVEDRVLHEHIERAAELVRTGEVLRAVEEAVGRLA